VNSRRGGLIMTTVEKPDPLVQRYRLTQLCALWGAYGESLRGPGIFTYKRGWGACKQAKPKRSLTTVGSKDEIVLMDPKSVQSQSMQPHERVPAKH
jgi:hypothetical protein